MPEPFTPTPAYAAAADEKIVPVMAYTSTTLYIGEVIVKNLVRVSTWLRTNMAPDIIHLYRAKCLQIISGEGARPQAYPEIFLPTAQIIAFHILPPAKEQLDYDANEPNRRMEPATAIVGLFRMDGYLRIASKSDLAKFIELSKETFTGMYDVEIVHPGMPSLGVVRASYVMVRQANTAFAARSGPR